MNELTLYQVSPLRRNSIRAANFSVLVRCLPEHLRREVRIKLGWKNYWAVSV